MVQQYGAPLTSYSILLTGTCMLYGKANSSFLLSTFWSYHFPLMRCTSQILNQRQCWFVYIQQSQFWNCWLKKWFSYQLPLLKI